MQDMKSLRKDKEKLDLKIHNLRCYMNTDEFICDDDYLVRDLLSGMEQCSNTLSFMICRTNQVNKAANCLRVNR